MIAVAVLYLLSSLWIGLNAVAWLHLLWLRHRAPPLEEPPPLDEDALPPLVVQLPLYNEAANVEGLLASAAALDWPADRFSIQVLDDSTDHTPERVAVAVERLQAKGVDIHHIRRGSREGFKAGALAAGLEQTDAPLVAIFDADFRPAPNFLKAAVRWLSPDVGLVQARWAFQNRDVSVLTMAQAMHLDAHFALEQQARSEGGLLMGFNGTAGVWRRETIAAAGGWDGDTLTEDLDLAYRAQLAGWKLRYVDFLSVISELPEETGAIRSQQHRWIRGGAQVARKLLAALWRSKQPLRRKLQGSFHLMASTIFIPVLLLAILTPLIPLVTPASEVTVSEVTVLTMGVAGALLRGVLVILVVTYGVVCVHRAGRLGRGLWRMVTHFPIYLALATAISAHNSYAAALGWLGPTGTFVRTPKKGERVSATSATPSALWVEIALAVWSWIGALAAISAGMIALTIFLGFQAIAFTLWSGINLRAAAGR
ncbi:MAG: glycosyltransferase [Myxococcota bacterium]